MPTMKPLMPLSLTILLATVAGCAHHGGSKTAYTTSPQYDRSAPATQARLVEAKEELQQAQKQVQATMQEIIAIREVIQQYTERLYEVHVERHELADSFAPTRRELEQGSPADLQTQRKLTRYVEQLMETEQEYETVSNMLRATQQQLETTLQTQHKRFQQLMEKMVKLHQEIESLEQRLGQTPRSTAAR